MPIPDKKCEAKTRRGTPCQQPAMRGNARCRLHGGKSLSGVASPSFKHGKHSKYLYDRLQSSYEENLKDQTLLELVDEIAALRAMIQEQMEKGESDRIWRDALAAYKPVRRASQKVVRTARATASQPVLGALRELEAAHEEFAEFLKEADADARVREETKDDFERVRKLVDTEHKHRIDHRMVLTAEQVANHVAALVGILRRHVRDRRTLDAISSDIRALDAELSRAPG